MGIFLINNHIITRDEIYSESLILQLFEDKELKLTFITYKQNVFYTLTILDYTPIHQECLNYLLENYLASIYSLNLYGSKYKEYNLYCLKLENKLLLELL